MNRTRIPLESIVVGRYFVKSFAVREIIEDLGSRVVYLDYLRDTGEPYTEVGGRCLKSTLRAWAEREATPDEIERLQRRRARELRRSTSYDMAGQLLGIERGNLSEKEFEAKVDAALRRARNEPSP